MNNIHIADALSKIRGRIAELGVRKADVAHSLGIDPTLLSAILHRRRPPPPGFFEKVNAALDRLERAEKAGQEAREKVLNEGVA